MMSLCHFRMEGNDEAARVGAAPILAGVQTRLFAYRLR